MEETLPGNALIPSRALKEVEGGDLARAPGAVNTEPAPHEPEDPAAQTIHMAFSSTWGPELLSEHDACWKKQGSLSLRAN